MSLLTLSNNRHLPNETIWIIFRQIGAPWFRQHFEHQIISKAWYEFAGAVTIEDVQLSTKNLEFFLGYQHAPDSGQPPINLTRMASIQNNIREFRLCCRGTEIGHYDRVSEIAGGHDRASQLDKKLDTIISALKTCTMLRHVQIHVDLARDRRPYVLDSRLKQFLDFQHLTSLEFDIWGQSSYHLQHIQGPFQDNSRARFLRSPKVHFCTSISRLLVSLRRLMVRMPEICPSVLEPPNDSPLLKLKEVTVNLLISNDDVLDDISNDQRNVYRPAKCCRDYRVRNQHVTNRQILQDLMEQQASALVSRMWNPVVVRVASVHPDLDNITHRSYYDAITGNRRRHRRDKPWDAPVDMRDQNNDDDGSESVSESSDSSSSDTDSD